MTSSGTAWVQISETLFFLNVGPMTSRKPSARLTSSGVLRATPLMLYSQRQPKCTVNTDLRLTVVTWVCRAATDRKRRRSLTSRRLTARKTRLKIDLKRRRRRRRRLGSASTRRPYQQSSSCY